EFRPGRDGDVLDLYRLATDPVGLAVLARLSGGRRGVVRRRHRHRAGAVQAAAQRLDPVEPGRVYRAVQHPQQRRRLSVGLHDQDLPDPVRPHQPVRRPHRHARGRDDRRDRGAAVFSLCLLPLHPARAGDAGGRGEPGIGAARRHPRRVDDRARLGDGGGGGRGGRDDDRAGRVPRTQHDAGRIALRLRGGRARRADQPARRRHRRVSRRHHRKPRRDLRSLFRARAQAEPRADRDRGGADVQTERYLRPQRGEPGMTVPTTIPETAAAGAASRPRGRRLALNHLAIGAVLIVAVLIPLFTHSFVVFELTQVMIYGLAILGLNILTGFNGQFSLGHSAFYGLGAYTAAVLMHQWEVNYLLTLPAAGLVCFAVGFLFGLPALRLQNLYLALATFALATAMPQLLKFHAFEGFTGGVQGIVVDQ